MRQTFGEFILAYRRAGRMNQNDLARKLGIDRTTISKWESESSLPALGDAGSLAEKLGVPEESLIEAIQEAIQRRTPTSHTSIIGNYVLFQWSYLDRKIMKTNINVRATSAGRRLLFTEDIMNRQKIGIINGTVDIEFSNLFFFGKSKGQFKEYELIIANIPEGKDSWVLGVAAGVSSNEFHFPCASRAVLHYIGEKEFAEPPQYLPLAEVDMPQSYKKFLSKSPDASHPIITARKE